MTAKQRREHKAGNQRRRAAILKASYRIGLKKRSKKYGINLCRKLGAFARKGRIYDISAS